MTRYGFIALFAAAAVYAIAQEPPRVAGYFVPAIPASAPVEPADTNLVVEVKPEYEWELSFEWLPELTSTNPVAYPISIRVPFEHDTGFVRIVARKVESPK